MWLVNNLWNTWALSALHPSSRTLPSQSILETFSSKELFGDVSFPILSSSSWTLPCNKVLKMGRSQYLILKTTVVCTSLENHPKKLAQGTQQNENTNKAQWKVPTKISKSYLSWKSQRQSGLTLPWKPPES